MTADAPSIRTMALRDHAEVLRPVQATPGGSVRDADAYAERAATSRATRVGASWPKA